MHAKNARQTIDKSERRLKATLDRRQLLLPDIGEACYLGLGEIAIATDLAKIATNVFEHGGILQLWGCRAT